MASDRLVTPEHILRAVMEHERRGSMMLPELEKLEPDLAEFLLERSTTLFHQLAEMGLSGRDVRKLHRQAEKTLLVCVMPLRNAHRDLWEKDLPEPPARSADGSFDPPQ
jgi:hypothetical protein